MKRKLHLIALSVFTSFSLYAQPPGGGCDVPYPYSEAFEGGSASLALWSQGSLAMFNAYANHGTGTPSSYGLTKLLSQSTGIGQKDSITSPSIGTLTSTSQLSFDYRIVEYTGGFATNTPTLASDFSIKVIAMDGNGLISVPLFVINSTNHVSSLSFAHKSISLGLGNGLCMYLKFVITRGVTGVPANQSFNVDIDNVTVADVTGINSVKNVSDALINSLANSSISIQSANNISNVQIFTVDGKVVYNEKNYQSGNEINLGISGLYFVQFNNGATQERRKIFVK